MHRLARSLVATAAAAGLLTAAGCGGATWPTRAVGISTGAFAHHAPDVATIDILPLDLQVWGERGHEGDLAPLQAAAEVDIMNTAIDALAKRDYQVGAVIDWNGEFPGGTALPREDLRATVGALAHYGAAAAQHPGQLPVPYLPARLGTATGADATLYVGGWAYVASPRESTAAQVGKAVLIGLAVLTVVAILVAVADGHDHHHGSSRDHRGGRASAPSLGGGARGFGHGGFHHRALRPLAGAVDAFGRVAVDIALSAPDWSDDDSLPHEGGQSQMYLEMTLVDNRTGLALWHAHQTFPAQLGNRSDAARVARTLLALLPSHAQARAQP